MYFREVHDALQLHKLQNPPHRQSNKLTCDEISVMELTHGVRLEPGNFVTEVAIKDGETVLRQGPGVADVHLRRRERQNKRDEK